MTLLGYARVSSGETQQRTDLQIDALTAAGAERIFTDHASGAVRERAALNELLAYAREGDVILCWRLDRIARNARHAHELCEQLLENGVGFRSLTEGLDISTSTGRMMLGILASLAAWEREVIVERVQAGLQAARDRNGGKNPGGRPRRLTDEQVRLAKRLIGEGKTVVAAARMVGCSRRTLYRAIARLDAEEAVIAAASPAPAAATA